MSACGRAQAWPPRTPGPLSIVLPASDATAPGTHLEVSAYDWHWAAGGGGPLTFSRPADGWREATLALPLARISAAPGRRLAGTFPLRGGPPGARPTVTLDASWAPLGDSCG